MVRRSFAVPDHYRSSGIGELKKRRVEIDPKRKDLSPTCLTFSPQFQLKIARHFGFCFGVENAIEIAYRALAENPDKNIFLLGEIIHNPEVNGDLEGRGIRFLLDTAGNRLIDFQTLKPEDIVIVPAFGTTRELEAELSAQGVSPLAYDTTCPFVQKVWKRAAELGARGFSVVIHGKRTHEETRATFSHSQVGAPTLVVLDKAEALEVAAFIRGEIPREIFEAKFRIGMSEGFDPDVHLHRFGVVNQTTMLASETQEIAALLREALAARWGEEAISDHFADTRDTLCYATNENQTATIALLDSGIDAMIVVGGYKSSNTSHLVELAQERVPTFYIQNAEDLIDSHQIRSFDFRKKHVQVEKNWLPENWEKLFTLGITAGASCPDSVIESVIQRISSLLPFPADFSNALEVVLNSLPKRFS